MSPTSSPTDDSNTIYNGIAGDDSGSNSKDGGDKKGAAAAVEVGRSYGLAVVLASLFAGFAML